MASVLRPQPPAATTAPSLASLSPAQRDKVKHLTGLLRAELEPRGDLAKIKAQLSATAFDLLHRKSPSAHLDTPPLSSTVPPHVLSLVAEFLAYYGLSHSLHTFLLETATDRAHVVSRAALAAHWGVNEADARGGSLIAALAARPKEVGAGRDDADSLVSIALSSPRSPVPVAVSSPPASAPVSPLPASPRPPTVALPSLPSPPAAAAAVPEPKLDSEPLPPPPLPPSCGTSLSSSSSGPLAADSSASATAAAAARTLPSLPPPLSKDSESAAALPPLRLVSSTAAPVLTPLVAPSPLTMTPLDTAAAAAGAAGAAARTAVVLTAGSDESEVEEIEESIAEEDLDDALDDLLNSSSSSAAPLKRTLTTTTTSSTPASPTTAAAGTAAGDSDSDSDDSSVLDTTDYTVSFDVDDFRGMGLGAYEVFHARPELVMEDV
ncbi:hypothetical protein H9P43_008426 [Blastocladiella emersonii ATCC 22665]|nr:hypothetical protein H9P43_008426 [Blastocladiella emersonii ATCC 22665]